MKRCTVKWKKETSDRDYDSIQVIAGTVNALKSPAGFVDHYSEKPSWLFHPLLYDLLW